MRISEEQRHHLLKVLRMETGAAISYTDGAGIHGEGKLTPAGVERGDEAVVPRPSRVTVAVAAPSSRQRARFLVEKLAELGVEALLWVQTAHSDGRPPTAAKAGTWAQAALEQSRGAWLMGLSQATIPQLDPRRIVVADRDGEPVDSARREIAAPVLLVGPEGGLHADEIPDGVRTMTLGPTVLRVETAAVVGATLLSAPRGASTDR